MVIVIKIAVSKFRWSITKRSCLKLAVHCGDNELVKDVLKSGSPTGEYGGAIN